MSHLNSSKIAISLLSDDHLLQATKNLVQLEKQTTLEILQHLKEVERRRLYSQRGFSSLYTYCIEELNYSESQAHRRISSMRLIRDIPEVEAKIASGKLTLATASQAQSFFRKEAKEKGEERNAEQKKEVLLKLEGQSKREAEKSLLELCPQLVKFEEHTKPLTPEYTQVSIVLSSEQEAILERLKQLKPDKQSIGELFEWLMQRTLKQIDPLSKGLSTQKLSLKPKHLSRDSNSRRYIPASFKREIWQRASGCCEYKDHKSERKCSAQSDLQVDHIQPLALGGKTELENLRLLCRSHNQWTAILALGERKMKPYIEF